MTGTMNGRPGATVNKMGTWASGQAEIFVTAPATPDAARWSGYGTALKPAHELICVARKPFKGTLVQNLKAHGTGALDINAGRIPVTGKPPGWLKTGTVGSNAAKGFMGTSTFRIDERTPEEVVHVAEAHAAGGRWPPNFLLSHLDTCQKIGTKAVKAISTDRPEGIVRKSGVHTSAGWHQSVGRVQPAISYENGDGGETIDEWACVPGCAVAALDSTVGKLKSGKMKVGQKRKASYGKGGPSRFFMLPDLDALTAKDLTALDVGFYTSKVHPRDRKLPGYMMIVPESPKMPGAAGTVSEALAQELCARWEIPQSVGETWLETLTGWPIPYEAVEEWAGGHEPDKLVIQRLAKGLKEIGLSGVFVSRKEPEVDSELERRWGMFIWAKHLHPTTKPLSLGKFLVRVFSPRPETVDRPVVVLDPFGGSGTFALAAALEGRTAVYNDFTAKFTAVAAARFEEVGLHPLPAEELRSPEPQLWGGEATNGHERTCPKCGTLGPIETLFGYRKMKRKDGEVRDQAQSWCRPCRATLRPSAGC